MSNPREMQARLRFGKYTITQIPLNFVLGELYVTSDGVEKVRSTLQSYHKSYACALEALYDKMLADKMKTPQIDMVKKLIEEIKNAKEEIISAFDNMYDS